MNNYKFQKGQPITVSEFSYTNTAGGTGMSNWWRGEKFPKYAKLIITKTWYDYETGVRGWAQPDPSDTDLIEYLKRNAKQDDKPCRYTGISTPVNTVFWSQHNIVTPK